jgi:hypothetical protein
MATIPCPSCKAVNNFDEDTCTNCGETLLPAKLDHSINEIKKTTERLKDLTTPRKTFYSINGCGTTLLDYRRLDNGTYAATRWVIVFGLPIMPLSGYVIEPTSQEFKAGSQEAKFTILDKTSIAPVRVLRTYLLAAIGVLPLLLGSLNSSWVNRTLGGGPAFLAMIAAFVWLVYIIFYKLKNEGAAYKKTAPAA